MLLNPSYETSLQTKSDWHRQVHLFVGDAARGAGRERLRPVEHRQRLGIEVGRAGRFRDAAVDEMSALVECEGDLRHRFLAKADVALLAFDRRGDLANPGLH